MKSKAIIAAICGFAMLAPEVSLAAQRAAQGVQRRPAAASAQHREHSSTSANIGSISKDSASANKLRDQLQTQNDLLNLELSIKEKTAKLSALNAKIHAGDIRTYKAKIKALHNLLDKVIAINNRLAKALKKRNSGSDVRNAGHSEKPKGKDAAMLNTAIRHMYITSIFGAGRNAIATLYYKYNIMNVHPGQEVIPNVKVKRIGSDGVYLENEKTGQTIRANLTTREFAYNQTLDQLMKPSPAQTSHSATPAQPTAGRRIEFRPTNGGSIGMQRGTRIPPFK